METNKNWIREYNQKEIDSGKIKVIQTKNYEVRINTIENYIILSSKEGSFLCGLSFLQVLINQYVDNSLKK